MLPIRNISYLLPMCCSFWETCINSQKTGLGCSIPLTTQGKCYTKFWWVFYRLILRYKDIVTTSFTHSLQIVAMYFRGILKIFKNESTSYSSTSLEWCYPRNVCKHSCVFKRKRMLKKARLSKFHAWGEVRQIRSKYPYPSSGNLCREYSLHVYRYSARQCERSLGL